MCWLMALFFLNMYVFICVCVGAVHVCACPQAHFMVYFQKSEDYLPEPVLSFCCAGPRGCSQVPRLSNKYLDMGSQPPLSESHYVAQILLDFPSRFILSTGISNWRHHTWLVLRSKFKRQLLPMSQPSRPPKTAPPIPSLL